MFDSDVKYIKSRFEKRGFIVKVERNIVNHDVTFILKNNGNKDYFLYIPKYFENFEEKRTYVEDFINSSINTFNNIWNKKKGNTEMNINIMTLADAKETYLNCDGTIIPVRIEKIERVGFTDTEIICTLPSTIDIPYHKIKKKSDFAIKDVIFNPPATIVFWTDNTKTVVKAGEHDIYDPEKGLVMAIAKKVFGNEGNYYNEIRKWVEPYLKKCEEEIAKYADKFSRDQVVFSDEVEKALPWRIWFNDNAGIVGCYYKIYYRRCNAVQVANRLSLKNPDLNYVVSKTNPWGEESDASCQE